MGWIILLVALVTTFLVAIFLAKKKAVRWRSAHWDDLHARGKLIASQLAHLRTINAQNQAPMIIQPKFRTAEPPKKQRLLWPRRMAIPPENARIPLIGGDAALH